jgi:hypothetical protein
VQFLGAVQSMKFGRDLDNMQGLMRPGRGSPCSRLMTVVDAVMSGSNDFAVSADDDIEFHGVAPYPKFIVRSLKRMISSMKGTSTVLSFLILNS